MTTDNRPATHSLDIGDYIFVPAWKAEGLVVAMRPDTLGVVGTVEVLMEARPDDPNPKWYRLEPNEFEVL